MALDDSVQLWAGTAYRHIPASPSGNVLDFRFAGRAPDNRWNASTEPTLYLASDRGVALAEYARHVQVFAVPGLAPRTQSRQLYRLELRVERLLDLRDPRALAELKIDGAPACFLDKQLARRAAQRIRLNSTAQGMLVPAMAFLDEPARWALVLFLDKLPADPRAFITAVAPEGAFHLDT